MHTLYPPDLLTQNHKQHTMRINIIAAVARNRAIGKENKLIYWLPNDLKRFKALTTGHTIIMGRNTYLSLPKVSATARSTRPCNTALRTSTYTS